MEIALKSCTMMLCVWLRLHLEEPQKVASARSRCRYIGLNGVLLTLIGDMFGGSEYRFDDGTV